MLPGHFIVMVHKSTTRLFVHGKETTWSINQRQIIRSIKFKIS